MTLEEEFNEEDIDYMFKVADRDNDGFISYNEYLRVIMNQIDE
jgi:Ca2+-binding EF-hand superfamily protein